MTKTEAPKDSGKPTGTFQFLLDNATVILPGMYLLASAIGMLDSWWYYRQFGINIFYYSDLADFLLASFRSPTAWLVVLLSFAILAWDTAGSWRDARREKSTWFSRIHGSVLYRRLGWIVTFPMVAVYIVIYADNRAAYILERNMGQEIEITLADDTSTNGIGILLGSSLNFIFVYHPESNSVAIHPYNNVITVQSALSRPATEIENTAQPTAKPDTDITQETPL